MYAFHVGKHLFHSILIYLFVFLGLKDILYISEDTSFSGLTNLDPLTLPDNHMCAIVSQLSAPNRLDVWHIDKSNKPIDLQLQYNYGK